ncbi:MAG: preprotein translocase subunit SecE [Clostridiaceae bacterium]
MAIDKAVKANKPAGNKLVKYFKDLKSEIKRITWPTKENVKKSTIVVSIFCIILLAIVSLYDYGFNNLYRIIFIK